MDQFARQVARVVVMALCGCGVSTPADVGHDVSGADANELDAPLPIAMCGAWAPPPQSGAGRAWYVDPAGNDGADGSAGAPLRTIQAAADRAAPSDTVIVRDGAYEGPIGARAVVRVARGGTDGNWLWFMAENRGRARVASSTNAIGFDLVEGASFVRIQGFDVSGLDGALGASGIHIDGVHDVEVVGNHFHEIGRVCTDSRFGIDGVYVRASRVRVEGNLFESIGRLGPGERGCVPGNAYWQNHDHGVYLNGASDRAQGVLIVNNVFLAHEHGWGVHVFDGTVRDLTVAHNTFIGANPHLDGQVILAPLFIYRVSIVANVFASPRNSGIFVDNAPMATDLVVVDNVTSAPVLVTDSGGATLTPPGNVVGIDPLVGVGGTPDGTSPLIDGAAPIPAVPRDALGCPRPAGPRSDVGAIEVR